MQVMYKKSNHKHILKCIRVIDTVQYRRKITPDALRAKKYFNPLVMQYLNIRIYTCNIYFLSWYFQYILSVFSIKCYFRVTDFFKIKLIF